MRKMFKSREEENKLPYGAKVLSDLLNKGDNQNPTKSTTINNSQLFSKDSEWDAEFEEIKARVEKFDRSNKV